MKKLKEWISKNDKLAHVCLALSHCTTMACCLYYPWLIRYDFIGGVFSWMIASSVTLLFCYWKERTDKTGFSTGDLWAGG